MTKIIAALAFGYLLVALEAIVPGGILGLLGFVCLLAASYFAHLEFGGWMIPLVVFMLGGFGAVLLVFFQFRWLSQSSWGKNMFVHATSGGNPSKHESLEKLIGQKGLTQTDHYPEGTVRVDGKNFDSFCNLGYLAKNKKVEIVKVDGFRLIVRPL
jgi:membrane-bound serine protease (ClpP class)